jgi:hypothetical protein
MVICHIHLLNISLKRLKSDLARARIRENEASKVNQSLNQVQCNRNIYVNESMIGTARYMHCNGNDIPHVGDDVLENKKTPTIGVAEAQRLKSSSR